MTLERKMPSGIAISSGGIQKKSKTSKKNIQKSGKTLTGEPADQVLINPNVDEAATLQLRLHRAAIMRRNAKKIARARELARQRLAKAVQMRRRALKRARSLVRTRVAGAQGAQYNKLSTSDKIAVDRLTDKRKKQIIRIANRLAPRVKRDELQRLAAVAAGRQVRNSKTPIIASYEVDMNKTQLTERAALLGRIRRALNINEVSDELATKSGMARLAATKKAGADYRATALQPDHVRKAALDKLKGAEAKQNKNNKLQVKRSDKKFKAWHAEHIKKLAARSPEQVKKDNDAENAERHKNYKERGWTLD